MQLKKINTPDNMMQVRVVLSLVYTKVKWGTQIVWDQQHWLVLYCGMNMRSGWGTLSLFVLVHCQKSVELQSDAYVNIVQTKDFGAACLEVEQLKLEEQETSVVK